MSNKNYIRGYVIERKAKKELEGKGYYCMRSSGSHSVFDLIAIPLGYDKKRQIKLIQLKRKKGKYSNYAEDIDMLKRIPIAPNVVCSKEFWIWTDRHGWDKLIVD